MSLIEIVEKRVITTGVMQNSSRYREYKSTKGKKKSVLTPLDIIGFPVINFQITTIFLIYLFDNWKPQFLLNFIHLYFCFKNSSARHNKLFVILSLYPTIIELPLLVKSAVSFLEAWRLEASDKSMFKADSP